MRRIDKLYVTAYILAVALMLIARDVFAVSINKWLFVAIAGVFMTLSTLPAVIYMTAFSIPLLCGIPGTYIMLLAAVFIFAKLSNVNSHTITICIILIVLEFVASIWYIYTDIVNMVSYLCHVIVLMLMVSDDILRHKDISSSCIAKLYLAGSTLLCVVIITTGLISAPENWLELYSKGWYRFGATQTEDFYGMALTLNANNLGYYGIIGVFLAIHLMRKERNGTLYIAVSLVHAAAGVLALSRSFLVMSALCMLMIVFLYPKSIKGIIGTFIGTAFVGIIIAWVLSKYPDILTGWVTRMTSDDVSTGNGRVGLLLEYLEAWLMHPRCILLGAGVTGYKGVIGLSGSMHNALEQVLVCYGFAGAAVFLYGLIRPVLQVSQHHKVYFADWMPLISLVLFAQTIQFVNPTMLMMPYAIAVHAMVVQTKCQDPFDSRCKLVLRRESF